MWGPWSEWSQCSQTCVTFGQYSRKHRKRNCDSLSPDWGEIPCEGNSIEYEVCVIPNCPVDGYWRKWSEWGPCSVSCGNGFSVRKRQCNPPKFGGNNCEGNTNTQSKNCFIKECLTHNLNLYV